MKCLNCGSPRANEINVSVNISETDESEEVEYTGTTNYGDPSSMIGTYCYDCGKSACIPGWEASVVSFVAASGGLD